MKKVIFSFLLLSSLLFTNCSDPIVYDWFIYAETQCADPWETSTASDAAEVESAVENYLSNISVCVDAVELIDDGNSIITCQACDCPSGRGIRVRADENDSAILLGTGFYTE